MTYKVRKLTTDKTADQVEAEGLKLKATRQPGQQVEVGDGCTITSSDGCEFIGTIERVEPLTLSVWVHLS